MEIMEERVWKCLKRAQLIWPEARLDYVGFDLTGSTSGMAHNKHDGSAWIRLNKAYCMSNPQEMLDRTIPHEVAHIVNWQVNRLTGHGREWREIFEILTGDKATRCHEYGTQKEAMKRVESFAERLLRELE